MTDDDDTPDEEPEQFLDVQPFPNGETLLDRLIASGVLGSGSSDHPADLSTNPKYMEGFGESQSAAETADDASAIKNGLDAFDRGETRPAGEFLRELDAEFRGDAEPFGEARETESGT